MNVRLELGVQEHWTVTFLKALWLSGCPYPNDLKNATLSAYSYEVLEKSQPLCSPSIFTLFHSPLFMYL